MLIDGVKIGGDAKPYLIAEIGINHNGDFETCCKLIRAAKACGVSAAKLQVFNASQFLSESSVYFDIFNSMSFSADQYAALFKEAAQQELTMFASVFDFDCLDLMESLNTPAYKIASGDITHLPLLQAVSKAGKPMIVSTGGATIEECWEAVDAIKSANSATDIALLHCVSNYPANYADANLASIRAMKAEFALPVGFSDHTIGSAIPIAAVGLGADIIEKHFTLNIDGEGLDHASSADPLLMKNIAVEMENVYAAIGVGKKAPVETEEQITNIRRSIVAKTTIEKGVVINAEHLTFKRPNNGIAPKDYSHVIGKKADRRIEQDSPVKWSDLV